ncbi:L-seryl-tRNA(Sec) selenium transferase [Desulfobacter postgatei]|jgi:L-seryl-tRNA(Ser) seleniumtransferase|uniref:L-seryl-tRNA(Sec) selenium transferase n=1 Tax=Desulfobacter postgatei TaxID=2293 RepID=UPI002A36C195|nr:L-seryl-tRNA(Sec) selenium transferase [Desulfobacter postgatei]MDX9963014.1 L-seryl-tRNA(Sec) selenium transferase [Desulfobacter postgatei]
MKQAIPDKHLQLKSLPSVDHILALAQTDDRFARIPRSLVLESVRRAIDNTRTKIREGSPVTINDEVIIKHAALLAAQKMKNRLTPLINATGVVLHTNLGRALLCRDALDNIMAVASAYSNLELNLVTGKRGIRYAAIEELICELTGAQAAMAVNNNAGAVLLALNTLAQGRQVIVSRGELVEIGGSFRVPDVMIKSGCILKEVGTTNRTHPHDYTNAITEDTGLLLKVHTSNYKIEGFTTAVSLKELVDIGKAHGIPVMEDLGSGTLIDLSAFGLPSEPPVFEQVASGANVVTFSGDKLLGGPQAGILVGTKQCMDQIKANPLTRALRIDKMTLAALEATLKLYRDTLVAVEEIPTLRMLTLSYEQICRDAEALFSLVTDAVGNQAELALADMTSRPGGGSYPGLTLPTRCLTIRPKTMSVTALDRKLRAFDPPVMGRIENDRFIIDPRTLQPGQDKILANILKKLID